MIQSGFAPSIKGSNAVFAACVLFLLVLLLQSCGADGIDSAQGSGLDAGGKQVLPAQKPGQSSLPALPSGRETAGLGETLIQGVAAQSKSAGAVEQGTAMLLDSAGNGNHFEWAIYSFHPAPGAGVDSLHVELDIPQDKQVWLGLSDYTARQWRITGPYASSKTLAADNPDLLSPAGDIFCAVIVTPGSSATVNALSVRTLNPANQAPVADLVTGLAVGPAPLTVDFDASASNDVDGSIIEYAWDFDGNGTYEEFTDDPTVSHTFTKMGSTKITVRVTDDQFAHDSDFRTVNVIPVESTTPQAFFSASSIAGTVPLAVSLNASQSDPMDADETIVLFEWDWEGDGIFDLVGTNSKPTHTFHDTGKFDVKMRATDSAGLSDIFSRTILVTPQTQTITNIGNVGAFSSMAIVNGKPAISYQGANMNLMFVQAMDAAGTTWNTPVSVVAAAGSGFHTSLAVVNGNPAICYLDSASIFLKYVRALNADGSAWSLPVTVDNTQMSGEETTLMVVNGNPAICYYNFTDFDLLYVRATNADGTAWGAKVTVDATGIAGNGSSMQIVDGNPAIAYQGGDTDLLYIRAADPDGGVWNPSVVVDSDGLTGYRPSLSVINNQPAVAYEDGSVGDLRYVRASDIDGLAWGTPQTIDNFNVTGDYASLTTINGFPAIAYTYSSVFDLQYVRATDLNGNAWGPIQVIDTLGDVGWYATMLEINGTPAISYYDITQGDLRYVHGF